jgi:hypothetical protein
MIFVAKPLGFGKGKNALIDLTRDEVRGGWHNRGIG